MGDYNFSGLTEILTAMTIFAFIGIIAVFGAAIFLIYELIRHFRWV